MSPCNRNLTPMPTTIAPPGLKFWHCFAFLIATAVAYFYVGKLILFIAAIIGLVRGWWWLSFRFPKTRFSSTTSSP